MDGIGEFLLAPLLAYLINLASNERSSAIAAARERKLKEALEQEEALQKALAAARPIREELRAACIELARSKARLGVTPQEEPLWRLLSDDCFQTDLAEWLMAGGIVEGTAAKERLLRTMERALSDAGASPEQRAFLTTGYFDALDKAVFANPIVAHWRHQLSLDYLREQVAMLRRRAEEAAGVYSAERQKGALDRYCEKELAAWDIIDLSNLPEGDIHMATQKLLLRQLYMPLRIEVEPTKRGEADDAALARMEDQRESRRYREAGHIIADETDRPDRAKLRCPVGERLGASRRLVVLGDPGGGKTTMLRWMATAYLLRHKADAAFSQMPDTQALPNQSWIPVLIRCRDLGEADLCRCFADFLTQHLHKTELFPKDAEVMRAVILDRIAKGQALLLVDGLDEITNPRVRMMFCQELERTAARYPDAPMVVTSRIVGYRDMPYRMGFGFEHGQIAELNREDKDLFARRWVEVTEQHQSAAEKARRAHELLDALHSTDRIERLTGNPMLLTTLALVKRKVGKLPNKRTKLYAEAVSVLLNWNPRLYQTIEEDEAIPQLQYIAYEMCRRGVQRLTDDEVLELLDKLRIEYPNVRAIRRREPQAFLALLEARSSILIKSGGIWQKDRPKERPVWEFRHLTFQEYLAARALLDGRYPGRDKAKSLAEQVACLAGALQKAKSRRSALRFEDAADVPESWREALRLLVADCKDDDVDDVLLAILNPMAGEDSAITARPRVALAALCLADEPNVSEENANRVLSTFAMAVGKNDGKGIVETSFDRSALEVGNSLWSPRLKESLIHEYCHRPEDARWNVGGLWGMAEVASWKRSGADSKTFFTGLVRRLESGDRVEVMSAALSVMEAAYEGNVEVVESLPASLLGLLALPDIPAISAAAWALGWLSKGSLRTPERKSFWVASGIEVTRIGQALDAADAAEHSTRRWLAVVLGFTRDARALSPLVRRLEDPDAAVRIAVIEALVTLGDRKAVAPLLARLDDPDAHVGRGAIEASVKLGGKLALPMLLAKLDHPDTEVRRAIIRALGQLGEKKAVTPLLARLDDPEPRVRRAATEALARLCDKRAVAPLLTKLEDPEAAVRAAVIEALVTLGDKQVVPSLLAKLDDSQAEVRTAAIEALVTLAGKKAVRRLLDNLDNPDAEDRAATAAALHTMGEPKGTAALKLLLASGNPEHRQTAVRAYARWKEVCEQQLLSRDLDAADPWLDPLERVTEDRVTYASRLPNMTPDQVRSRYEAMAPDLNLKLTWKK